MSLDLIKIPGNIEIVDGSESQMTEIFVFAISTCMWCKLGKEWLNERGYGYSYLYIDKLPLKEKNKLKKDIENQFGVRPRFPFFVINKTQYVSGYEPALWEEMIK